MNNKEKIVFLDGIFGLCNGIVDFLIKYDKKNILKFAPLQGKYAQNNLNKKQIQDVDTIVFQLNGQTFIKSRAVIEILNQLDRFWIISKILNIFPTKILDIFYDLIVKYRYNIFGKRDTCRIPKPDEIKNFID